MSVIEDPDGQSAISGPAIGQLLQQSDNRLSSAWHRLFADLTIRVATANG
jgi:hypothetical protein